MISISKKLNTVGTTIFTKMSALANEYNAINLGQGFPNFDCGPALVELVTKYLNMGKHQYAPMPGVPALREVLAGKYNKQYACRINPDTDICITAGATQAIFTIISAFIHPGDEVIIFEPAYDCYRPSVEIQGGIVRALPLEPPEYKIDWARFESLLNAKTKLVILNNPHNPTGTTLDDKDLVQLQYILSDTNIILLSDEVYEHITFDQRQHQSVLKYPELFERSLAVFSFGKTFHVTGWKMGYCVAPAHLMKAFKDIHQWNVFSVNSFVQYALADYLEDETHYMGLASMYQAKRDYFQEAMTASAFSSLPNTGTYFGIYDYSQISDKPDVDFAEWLVREHGIACIPVSVFYSAEREDRLVRFCFAKTDELLALAAERLCQIDTDKS